MKKLGVLAISCVVLFCMVSGASALKFSTNDFAQGKSITFDAIKGLGHHGGAVKGDGAANPPTGDSGAPAQEGASVPEPATMLLLGAGLLSLAGLGRKRFQK